VEHRSTVCRRSRAWGRRLGQPVGWAWSRARPR
jgi:hypothetical protein